MKTLLERALQKLLTDAEKKARRRLEERSARAKRERAAKLTEMGFSEPEKAELAALEDISYVISPEQERHAKRLGMSVHMYVRKLPYAGPAGGDLVDILLDGKPRWVKWCGVRKLDRLSYNGLVQLIDGTLDA